MPRKRVSAEQKKPAATMYYRIFQQDKDGEAILTEMSGLFYDRPSHVKGDPYETAFKEGQRSVVAFIIRKCGLAISPEEANDGSAD